MSFGKQLAVHREIQFSRRAADGNGVIVSRAARERLPFQVEGSYVWLKTAIRQPPERGLQSAATPEYSKRYHQFSAHSAYLACCGLKSALRLLGENRDEGLVPCAHAPLSNRSRSRNLVLRSIADFSFEKHRDEEWLRRREFRRVRFRKDSKGVPVF